MKKAVIFIVFLLHLPLYGQPRIDSMIVNEAKRQLIIYGDVANNGIKPAVSIDSVATEVVEWSDKLCVCTLPDSGKGSAGPVVVLARNMKSNVRILSFWSGKYIYSGMYPRHWGFFDTLYFRVRGDLYSYLLHKTKQFLPLGVMRSTFLRCEYGEPTLPNPSGGYDSYEGKAVLPLYTSETKSDSSFECSCFIDIPNHILNISVSSVNGAIGEKRHSYKNSMGQIIDTSYYSQFIVSDFSKKIVLDSFYQANSRDDSYYTGVNFYGSNFIADSTLFPLPIKSLKVERENDPCIEVSIYPNPTKDKVTLDYFIKVSSDVSISLLDVSGKTIRQINATKQTQGQHQIDVDIRALPSGAFFLRTSVNGEVQTKKILIP